MGEQAGRGPGFERRMTDAEALMWAIEADPWLNPSGGVLSILDRPADVQQFRRRMAWAVSQVPRLRQRVVADAAPFAGRVLNPAWTTDTEFDLGHHVRCVALPAPGTPAQLHDLATRLLADPFDRTRPLWQFVLVEGLQDGRGALLWKLHHTVADGLGALRLAARFFEGTRDWPLPPEVDLDEVVARAAADERARGDGLAGAVGLLAGAARAPLGVLRSAAAEVALWGADPGRPGKAAATALDALGQLRQALGPAASAGSPLWATRSRHRRMEALSVPVGDVRAAAKRLGGTVNDLFVTGAVEAAVRYHRRRDVSLDTLRVTFVVSTRAQGRAGGNAFTPTPVVLPAGPLAPAERFAAVHERLAAGRAQVRGEGLLSQLAAVAKLVPVSALTGLARSQAAAIDFATSNIRGAPVDLYSSGARVLHSYALGPLVGTAFNLTALSFGADLDIGVHVDPAAVDDPGELRECLESAYADLLTARKQRARPRARPAGQRP